MASYLRQLAICMLIIAIVTMPGETSALARRRPARRSAPAVQVEKSLPAAEIAEEVTPLTAASEVRIDPRQALTDIMSLRQAQKLSDSGIDTEFAGALERLIAEKHGEPTSATAIEPITPIEPDVPATQSADIVLSLRQSAAHFDQRANEFEMRKAYADADAARQTADALRLEARRLDP